jgi:hypothetical protein
MALSSRLYESLPSLSPCLSAAGLRFSGHPAPAGGFSFPYGWLTSKGFLPFGTPSGLSRSASLSRNRLGCPLYSGVLVSSRVAESIRAPSDPSRRLGQSSCPAVFYDEASSRVHPWHRPRIHPSGLSLARFGVTTTPYLGHYPQLRTSPLPVTHVRIGNRR